MEKGSKIRRLPRGGRLFGPLVGLFWLAYPIQALLKSNPSSAQILFALAGITLFVAIFLGLIWLGQPLRAAATDVSEVRKRRAALASLVVLTLALALACGNEWLTLFFHVNVLAGLLLPRRDAYAAIAGLAILMVVFGSASGLGWSDIGQGVLSTGALGLLFTAFGNNIDTIAELRAAREEIARLAVAEERLRFARDLHDLLGYSLSLITLKSELAARLLPSSPEKAATEVRDIEGVARQALREVREAVAGYRRPTLDEELRSAREMLQAAGISCRIGAGADVLPGATDAVLAWAVREGVTNVIRHSRAKHCEIRVTRRDEELRAQITDDGQGPSPERDGASAGSGLSGLAERVAASGGALEAKPLTGGGFCLYVSLPARDDATQAAEPVSKPHFAGEDDRQ
ncbi:MAG TPA: sensor histidine kinase [Rubrobacteraceae bacterium]|nr:sensor histidine kinase [Rubrobacteraceae bacterium]